jgi:hypothetical protein
LFEISSYGLVFCLVVARALFERKMGAFCRFLVKKNFLRRSQIFFGDENKYLLFPA